MKQYTTLTMVAIVLLCALAAPVLAWRSVDGQFTVPATRIAITNDVPVASQSLEIDRIVVWNSGSVTQQVSVAALDHDVESFALARLPLAASAVTSVWPRAESITKGGQTNILPVALREVRFTTSTATNGSIQTIKWRIYGK